MQLKLLSLATLSCFAFAASVASAHSNFIKIPNRTSAASVLAYWTPERMQAATPMDLPVANENRTKISLDALKEKNKNVKAEMHFGKEPTVKFTPNQTQLFKPLEKNVASKMDTGTLNEYFSSQQLLPLSADQSYPYTTVGKLFFTDNNGQAKTCSASIIANRIMLTAAHCIHNGNGSSTGWYSNWMFVPAYRDGTAPFLSWSIVDGDITSDWYNGGGTVPNASDYAMLVLGDQTVNNVTTSVGSLVGTLGFQINSTMPNHAHILGYAGNLDGGEKMHQVTSQSAQAVDPNNVEYGSDMNLGAGGGPWIQNFGPASKGQTGGTNAARNMVIGLSSYGYSDTTTLALGSPVLDQHFVNMYKLVCSFQSGNC